MSNTLSMSVKMPSRAVDAENMSLFTITIVVIALFGVGFGATFAVRERWLVAVAGVLALLYVLNLSGSEAALAGAIIGSSAFIAWVVGVRCGKAIRNRMLT